MRRGAVKMEKAPQARLACEAFLLFAPHALDATFTWGGTRQKEKTFYS